MNSNGNFPQEVLKSKLSTLWVFIMINMAFADIVGMMYPGFLAKIVAGTPVDGIVLTPTLLLFGAVMLELPTLMILLSRVLSHGLNRWLNIIIGFITIVYVAGMASPTIVYWFFCSIEIIACLVIIVLAWRWKKTVDQR